jgi:signal transduction histidine kinase
MHKDGSRLQISVTISPIRDSTGTIIGASKVARDISQRIAAEEAMRKSRELKDEFLSLVSHELRTPIAVVVGNGNMLLTRERTLAPDDRRRAIEDIAYQGERLQRAIENVLLLTRIEAGERVKIGPIDLSGVTEQAIRELRPLHARQIDVDVSGASPTVRGNAALLFLVIENLISNADKFSEAGAKVDVCVRDDGIGFGEVHVCDRGPGLTHADLERVFDPFFRSDRYASRSTGLGLGLAVCKRAIEHQGGRISADQRPGGGLDFWFTLPYWVTPGAQP